MQERNFENVLQRYPELIEEGLKFLGRQVNVGGKFVDLLFIDRFKQNLIIELKKGVVKREHVAQLLDYEGHFLSDDNPNIRVMLIGNRVPTNLRNSLDHHGFEWKEIPVSALITFLRSKNDAELLEQFNEEEQTTSAVAEKIKVSTKIGGDVRRDHNKGHKWDHNLPYNQDGMINSLIEDGKSLDRVVEEFEKKNPDYEGNYRDRVVRHVRHLLKEHDDFPYNFDGVYFKRKTT